MNADAKIAHEEYVRQKWEHDAIRSRCYVNNRPFWLYIGEDFCTGPHANEQKAWLAAYNFTIAREEEIRQVEEEIQTIYWLMEHCSNPTANGRIFRILARETAALTELKRGMKEAKNV